MVDANDDTPVRIQFCSDMHLEMPLASKRLGLHLAESQAKCSGRAVGDDELENVVPCVFPSGRGYLALLGDIFNGAKIRDGAYKEYLLRQSVGFEGVFVIAGNHEFYRSEYGACRKALVELCAEVTAELGGAPFVRFLDCDAFDVPGTAVRLLGCTLWSCVGPAAEDVVSNSLNDYSAISVKRPDNVTKATVADTNSWHRRELDWLCRELARAAEDRVWCVVLTHHGPSFHGTTPPQFGQQDEDSLAAGFCSNLEHLLVPPVSAWLFGHTHWSSWQQYCAQGGKGVWSNLSGGEDCGGPLEEELASASSLCEGGRGVLVASNQLGYGAMQEHLKAAGTRCHPRMFLEVSRNGLLSRLCCAG